MLGCDPSDSSSILLTDIELFLLLKNFLEISSKLKISLDLLETEILLRVSNLKLKQQLRTQIFLIILFYHLVMYSNLSYYFILPPRDVR